MRSNSVSFSLLLNFKMNNVKSNWISCLLDSHIHFSKRISFHSQGKVRAAACVCVSDGLYRTTWWGWGGWRLESSPSSAQQALGLARLGSSHTDFASPPSSMTFFYFLFCWVLPSGCHAFWEKSASTHSGGPAGVFFQFPQRYSQGWQPTLSLVSFRKSTTINNFKLADKEGTPILKPFFTSLTLLLKQ